MPTDFAIEPTKVLPAPEKRRPPNAGIGRPKGIPNKNTTALKDMILAALEGVGGQAYLQAQAIENPGPFMTLIGKVLPMQVTGEGGGPVLLAPVDLSHCTTEQLRALAAIKIGGDG